MTDYIIKNAQVLVGDRFLNKTVVIGGGMIRAILPDRDIISDTQAEQIDGTGRKLVPGFFDNHTHGCMGIDFNLCSAADIVSAASHFASWGTTGFLPAVMTDSIDVMCRQLSVCAEAVNEMGCAAVRGIHLEGPFLSPSYKGAMPECYLRKPDYDLFMRFQEAACGLIRVVTIAPELEGAAAFTEKLVKQGVRVSVGHSGADYEQAMACIDAGASSCTHTMNGMKLLHMHDPAILTAVLESDIYCEIICDGFHLHPPIVRLLLKIKGSGRLIPVSDSMMAAGYPDGSYQLGVNKVTVKNGDAKLADTGVRAGSTLTMQKILHNILHFTGVSLEVACGMLSANAAGMLGLYDQTGSIETGKYADLALLDGNNNVTETFVRGKRVYTKSSAEKEI